MASTKATNNRCVWTYTDENGDDWAVGAKTVYVQDVTDGVKFGGSAPAASVPAIPKQLRMRAVKCIADGVAAKWVPVYETTAALWTTPGTTVTLNNLGVDVSYASTKGKRPERYRDGIRQTG